MTNKIKNLTKAKHLFDYMIVSFWRKLVFVKVYHKIDIPMDFNFVLLTIQK